MATKGARAPDLGMGPSEAKKIIASAAGFEPAREIPYDFKSYALTTRPS